MLNLDTHILIEGLTGGLTARERDLLADESIAISGIVEFRSNEAGKLPTTTTKRGIDAASPLYLQVKNKMREGLKLFTTYTYWWKGKESEAKATSLTSFSNSSTLSNLNSLGISKSSGRQQNAVPGRSFVTRQAGFRNRRELRQQRQPPRARYCERAQSTCLHIR